jgi:hypothetical protein
MKSLHSGDYVQASIFYPSRFGQLGVIEFAPRGEELHPHTPPQRYDVRWSDGHLDRGLGQRMLYRVDGTRIPTFA